MARHASGLPAFSVRTPPSHIDGSAVIRSALRPAILRCFSMRSSSNSRPSMLDAAAPILSSGSRAMSCASSERCASNRSRPTCRGPASRWPLVPSLRSPFADALADETGSPFGDIDLAVQSIEMLQTRIGRCTEVSKLVRFGSAHRDVAQDLCSFREPRPKSCSTAPEPQKATAHRGRTGPEQGKESDVRRGGQS